MPEFSEPQIRFAIFIGLFAIFGLLELSMPRRKLGYAKSRRWLTNIAIVVIDTLILRLLPVGLAVGTAHWAAEGGVGLFNVLPSLNWLSVILGFVILDFAIWFSPLGVAQSAAPVVGAPYASCRCRYRCDHRGPVSSNRNCALDAV